MEQAQEILVVILASFLALALLLNIILLIIGIKIALIVKRVTAKAEEIADKAEAFGDFVQSAATPMMIGKMLHGISEHFFNKKPKGKRK